MTTINADLGCGEFLTLNGLALGDYKYVLHITLLLRFTVVVR